MDFTQIVYYTSKSVVITSVAEAYIASLKPGVAYKVFQGLTVENFASALKELDGQATGVVIIEETDEQALQTRLAGSYTEVIAGGGLVYNDAGAVMMIFRRGKWDLPKGKLDEGETIEACAVREVEEETGITGLKLEKKLCDTWHLYTEKGKNLLKHSVWYRMHSSDTKTLVPQVEEDIDEVLWVAPGDLAPYVANTYEAIKDVLRSDGLL